ncbi:MAG: glucosyltransferase domain-containing protein [Phascolarctobacterium sp.]|nr:glucosyltransferase domain-containing protein [Phascolarctobacterium sp.]
MFYLKELREKIDWNFIFKLTAIFSVIFLIAISAILRANFNYIDDLGRTLQGYRGWENFSRYISTYLSVVVHAGRRLTDISPLPQFIAIICMAFSSAIVVDVFCERKKLSIWYVASLIPMTLLPYFLECLSYKFDAPYMALSVLGSIVPFLFYKFGYKVYMVVSIFGLLVMCMTYQVSSGIYPMITIFLCAKYWNQDKSIKEIKDFLAQSILSYVVGLLLFKVVFMKTVNTYVSNDITKTNSIFQTISENLLRYFSIIKNDATNSWTIFVALIAVAFVVSFIVSSMRSKMMASILAISVVILGASISYGAYLVLPKPLFAPRGMYGIGVFIALLGINSVGLWNKNILAKAGNLFLAWSLIVFSFTYGNALAEQKRYTDFRTQLVLSDISKLNYPISSKKYEMMLYGNAGKSPVVKNMERKYRVLSRLVPSTLGSNWWWNEYYLYNYFSLPNVKQIFGDKKKFKKFENAEIPVVVDTWYHTIKRNEKYILVKFK